MPRKHNPDQMQLSICAAGFCMVKWRRHLWDEQNHQGDVDREDDGQRSKREWGVLLGGQDHGDRRRDQAEHLKRENTGLAQSFLK